MDFNYNVIALEKGRYLEIISARKPMETEQQAIDAMSLCVENGTDLLLIHTPAVSESFFRLATGAAGGILQKLINYHIKTAFVFSKDMTLPERFQEMMFEANKGEQYRFYDTKSEAEQWLLSGEGEISEPSDHL